MSLINEENKTKFFSSFQSLVDYLLENSGIQEEDLPPILTAFLTSNLASEEDVSNFTNVDKVITVATAQQSARKAIEEWVQLAPDSLDTLQEIATALQNDPDILQKMFDLIAGKANQSDIDKRQVYSNIDFSSASWDAFFTFGAGGLSSKPSAIYHGVATTKRLRIADQYPNVPETEKCNVTVSISTEQYRILTLTEGNVIGDAIRLPVNHLNQVAKLHFVKNDVLYPVELDAIDSSSETELLITGTDWIADDVITMIFITHVNMEMTKRVFVNVATQAQGADFYRTAKIHNGSLQTENILEANVWRSSSLDLSYTIETIISAINEAIPDTDEPT